MSAKDDMVDKIGITHDGTKVHKMPQLHKTCWAVGSPPATFTWTSTPVVMLTLSLRSVASITTGYSNGRPPGVFLTPHGLLRWPPFGRLPHSSRVTQMVALQASSSLLTGYSNGRPSGVFLTPHGLLKWPHSGRLPHSSRVTQMAALRASSSLLTGYSEGRPPGVYITKAHQPLTSNTSPLTPISST